MVVLTFAAYTLVRNWADVWGTVRRMPWELSIGSLITVMAGIVAGVAAWRSIVRGLGTRISPLRAAQINLVGALGKYLPGSVWAYLLQMELGRKVGLPRSRVFTGALIQFVVSLVVTICFAAVGLPLIFPGHPSTYLVLILVPFGLLCLHPKILTTATNLALKSLRRKPLAQPLTFLPVLRTFGCQLVSYILFGFHLWVVGNAIGVLHGVGGLLLCVCAISIGLNSGVVAFVLPSGAGVRDGLIVALLMTAMPYSTALALALVSRLMFTVADVTTAGAAAALSRWRSPASEISQPPSSFVEPACGW